MNIDLSDLRRMYGDRRDLLHRILSSYNENLSSNIDELLEGWLARDFDAMHVVLHRMRPNAKLVGARKLEVMLEQLDKAALGKDQFTLEMLLASARAEALKVQDSITDILMDAPAE